MEFEVIRDGLGLKDEKGKPFIAPVGMVISMTPERAESRMMKLKPVETVVKVVKKKSRKSKK